MVQSKKKIFLLLFSKITFSVDGFLGTSISAPGAAIAGVSKSDLKCMKLADGTSMSSPNAVGSTGYILKQNYYYYYIILACLLSALKKINFPITPFRIRLAIENSALMLNKIHEKSGDVSPFAIGCGILQIDSAFELIKKFDNIPTSLATIDVYVKETNSILNNCPLRGIYLREKHNTSKAINMLVEIKPKFKKEADNNEKINFEMNILLCCNFPCVEHPKFFKLLNERSSFQVRVDPTNLEKGVSHYTEVSFFNSNIKKFFLKILGYDIKKKNGPIFRVPITIIVPIELEEENNFAIKRYIILKPATPYRLFVHVPLDVSFGSKFFI